MSCSNCNKPCIKVGGKCIIAIIREKTKVSFKEAWEAITHTQMNEERNLVYIPAKLDDEVFSLLNKQHKLIKQNDNKNKKRIPSKV